MRTLLNWFRDRRLVIKGREVYFPLPTRWPTFHLPSVRLGVVNIGGIQLATQRIKWIILATLILSVSVVAVGMYYAIIDVVGSTYNWPDAGRYEAKLTQETGATALGAGEKPSDATLSQTLALNIAGARINTIIIGSAGGTVSLGKASGLTDAIEVVASLNGDTPPVQQYIECEEVIFDGLVATSFSLSESEVYDLQVLNNVADGNSFSPTLSADPVDIVMGSTRGALNVPAVTDSSYDLIKIDGGTVTSTCKTLKFLNVKAYGGGVSISYIKAGMFTVQNSTIGSGTGIDSADFIIASTTKVQTSTLTGNVEQPVSVQ